MARDSAWNRAVKFPATFGGQAAQLRRAVERRAMLPNGKIVEFHAPIMGDRTAEPNCAEIILRQTVAAGITTDPREAGF